MQQKIRSDSLRAPLLYLNKPSTYLFKPNPASLQSGQLADISPATADKILMAGNQQLALISLVVRNYDEAIRFYV
ncbi:MAG: hypothetical protein HOP30_16885, partial [Cyclobacteriaceae bacterium]|nr:hypothetical protein [Cyclobacteriaceae bacterium]